MPEFLQLRLIHVNVDEPGFRTESIDIVTTLTDTELTSREEIAELYHARWLAELDIRAIKCTMGMDALRCKSPEMVRKEIWTCLSPYPGGKMFDRREPTMLPCRIFRWTLNVSLTMRFAMLRVVPSGLVVWLCAVSCAPIFGGVYADWELTSGLSGTATFDGAFGMPDLSFTLTGDAFPHATRIVDTDRFDNREWEDIFGEGDNQESLRFLSTHIGGTSASTATVTLRFDSAVEPTGKWAFAVTDLEGEDAIIRASYADTPVPLSVISSWFQGLFDSKGNTHFPSGYDAPNAAVVAELDPDGLLSTELMPRDAIPTESASAWFVPNTPIDTLTISHQNRWWGGGASMHVYLAVGLEGTPAATYTVADTDADSVFDDLGDKANDKRFSARASVGEVDSETGNSISRLVAKFNLPEATDPGNTLKSAVLRFFLEDITGTPAGPVSLYHGPGDNDLDRAASDFESELYTDTGLDLVSPTDAAQAFYELDVTDLVLQDYAVDGPNRLSAFRLQIDEAPFQEDNVSARYRFTMPGSAVSQPQLLLTFVPEPSSVLLAAVVLVLLAARPMPARLTGRR